MPVITKPEIVTNDLSFARIAYDNKLTSASSTDAAAVLIPNTYERWFSASGTMQATFQTSAVLAVDYVAIGAHNLATAGASILVETAPTVAGTFTARASVTPTTNAPLFLSFDTVSTVADIRITITGGTNREVGVIYAGEALIMQRALYGGHSPINLSSMTEYRNAMSDTGQFLGRKIRRQGQMTNFSWQYLTPEWYREYFQPFVVSAKTKPFFIRWRPDYHSDEVAFGYTTGDIKPSNMGGGFPFLTVSIDVRAHDE